MEREFDKAKIKKINLLLHIKDDTDPIKLVETADKVIKEFERRGIIASYIRNDVVVDPRGKAED